MIKRLLYILWAILLFVACKETLIDTSLFQGIGSIERTDSVFAIHYYDHTFLLSDMDGSVLEDSDRVEFSLRTSEPVSDTLLTTFYADIVEISEDITRPVVYYSNQSSVNPKEWGTVPFVSVDMHITRDWRRNDYFNFSTMYATSDGNDDYICLTYEKSEQEAENDSLHVMWLKHYQRQSDSLSYLKHDVISVPLNYLQKDSVERTYLRIKYFDVYGDTVVTNWTYSYRNMYVPTLIK